MPHFLEHLSESGLSSMQSIVSSGITLLQTERTSSCQSMLWCQVIVVLAAAFATAAATLLDTIYWQSIQYINMNRYVKCFEVQCSFDVFSPETQHLTQRGLCVLQHQLGQGQCNGICGYRLCCKSIWKPRWSTTPKKSAHRSWGWSIWCFVRLPYSCSSAMSHEEVRSMRRCGSVQ